MADSIHDLEAQLITARGLAHDDSLRQWVERRDRLEREQQEASLREQRRQHEYEWSHRRAMDAEDLIAKQLDNELRRTRNARAAFQSTREALLFAAELERRKLATDAEQRRRKLDDLEDYDAFDDDEDDDEEEY